jgi:hypothetical protein
MELTRGTRFNDGIDINDALLTAGRPLVLTPEEGLLAVTQLQMSLARLPPREKWAKMAGPLSANWRFLRACGLRGCGRIGEAAAEFRRAAEGGNAFGWAQAAELGERVLEGQLRAGIDAGDGLACGLLSRGLRLERASGRRAMLLETAWLGVRRADVRSFCVVALELTRCGRRGEARAVLRKLDAIPRRMRIRYAELEYEALRAVGRTRLARIGLRLAGLLGEDLLDYPGHVEDWMEGDPESGLAVGLLTLEDVVSYV